MIHLVLLTSSARWVDSSAQSSFDPAALGYCRTLFWYFWVAATSLLFFSKMWSSMHPTR